jgi:FMN phosphatase YigB (HAD superfamily)
MHFLFDWGDTLMADLEGHTGPMCDWAVVQAMPHAKETLVQLSKSVQCHLATNAKDSEAAQIRQALARVGLDSLITNIFCFRTVGHAKPSPEFFAYICQHLQVEPSELIMVGDDLRKDVMGALHNGLQAIWYNPKSFFYPADIHQINDLAELLPVAEQGGALDVLTRASGL